MTYRLIIFLLTLIVPLGRCHSCPPTKVDPYNFCFSSNASDFKWSIYNPQALMLDSSQLINNKYPLSFERSLKSILRCNECNWSSVYMSQRIFLPYEADKNMTVSIRAYSKYITEGWFYINRYNEKMELASQDSLNINIDGWNTHTITLPHLPTRVVDIGFLVSAIGTGYKDKFKQPDFKQCLNLDHMEIKIDGVNIESFGNIPLDKLSNPLKINSQKIVPLNFDSKEEQPSLTNRKILALGETVHYNDEMSRVAFEIIKKRIIINQCRLVMCEIDFNLGLLLNYYVSGAEVSSDFVDVMKKATISTFSQSWYTFFEWLREYNKDKKRKVLLLGIDRDELSYFRPELEVLNACFTNSLERYSFRDLFDYIANQHFNKADSIAEAKKEILKKNMNDETFKLFRDFLSLSAQYLESDNLINGKYFNEKDQRFLARDKFMFHQAQYYIRNFLNNDETACIYAHLGHVAKYPVGSFHTILPLGYYLHKVYGESYSPIAIVVGQGNSTIRGRSNSSIKNIKLTEPPINSIEYAAKKISNRCFYYPFGHESFSFNFIRITGTVQTKNIENYDESNQFKTLVSPKCGMDGFVYIPMGRSFIDAISNENIRQFKDADTFIFDRRQHFIKKNFKKD